ncbi:MAG: malate permease [Solirubrobacteraceae bacterium]|nr:malate permease [Solirubrobacteraceae bacterium]
MSGRLLDVLLYAVLPPMTFFIIARLELTAGVGAGLVFAYVAALAAGTLAWVIGRRVLKLSPAATGSLVLASMLCNTGYLGVPLTATLLGSGQIGPALAYDIAVSAPMMYVAGYGVAAALGDRAGDGTAARARSYLLRNPVLPVLPLALIAPDWLAPDAAVDVARVAAIALLPVGFFVLGVNLMGEREDGVLDFPPRMTPALATALGLRLLVAPGIMLGLSLTVLRVPDAYLLQAAMPTAINTLVAGHAYGLDLRLMAGAIAWSTAIVVAAALVATAIL